MLDVTRSWVGRSYVDRVVGFNEDSRGACGVCLPPEVSLPASRDGREVDPGGAFFFFSLLFITRPSGYAIVLGSRDCTAWAGDTYTNVSWLDVLCLVFLSFNIASRRVCSRAFGQRNTLYAHTWDPPRLAYCAVGIHKPVYIHIDVP
jgi:hypothetical protein